MRALTLKPPWPYAVFRLGKPVENRTWKPWKVVIGRRVAIHVGQSYDNHGDWFIRLMTQHDPRVKADLNVREMRLRLRGVIVGTVVVRGYYLVHDMSRPGTPWAFGPYCWDIADARELEKPIPYTGARGLWRLPEELSRQLERHGASGTQPTWPEESDAH